MTREEKIIKKIYKDLCVKKRTCSWNEDEPHTMVECTDVAYSVKGYLNNLLENYDKKSKKRSQ